MTDDLTDVLWHLLIQECGHAALDFSYERIDKEDALDDLSKVADYARQYARLQDPGATLSEFDEAMPTHDAEVRTLIGWMTANAGLAVSGYRFTTKSAESALRCAMYADELAKKLRDSE